MKTIAVYCSSSNSLDAKYYEQAEELGKWIGETGRTLVYGGSSLGLMEAVSRGARKAIDVCNGTGKVVGVVPDVLCERKAVSQNPDEVIPCKDLTERKQIMMGRSDVFIAMPGSIGTLDEAFSVMAQHIIGIDRKMVIFWNIDGFWNKFFEFLDWLGTTPVANKDIKSLYYRADTLEEVIALCEK